MARTDQNPEVDKPTESTLRLPGFAEPAVTEAKSPEPEPEAKTVDLTVRLPFYVTLYEARAEDGSRLVFRNGQPTPVPADQAERLTALAALEGVSLTNDSGDAGKDGN